jgi:RHS repeat-associated protein
MAYVNTRSIPGHLPRDRTVFDANGNTIVKTDSTDSTSYSWDFEDRLSSVILPGSGGTVSFKYDPFGRRIEKISPAATSIFVYDGNNLAETVNATGSTVARYTQEPSIDEPLAMQRGTTTDYYEQDGVGSVTSLSSSTATIAQSYTYDSFGNTTNSSGSLTNFFRYTGREFDTETGLYYNRARYYDPSAGRFVSEDPIGFLGGNDFFMYSDNDPTLLVDPFGLCPPSPRRRLLLAVQGLGNIGIGVGKIGLGAAATGETGGLAVALGIYGIYSGFGNIGGGLAQVGGAISGNISGGEEGSKAVSVALSPVGLATLIYTKGNLNTAAQNAQIEGLLSVPLTAGLTGELPEWPDAADATLNGIEFIRNGKSSDMGAKCSNKCN